MKSRIVTLFIFLVAASLFVISCSSQEVTMAEPEPETSKVEADTAAESAEAAETTAEGTTETETVTADTAETDTATEDAFGVSGLSPEEGSPLVPKGVFEKEPPYKIALAHNGFGNTWRIQSVEEAKYEASLHPEIEEFIFVEADNDPAKQVSQIQDLLTQDIDGLIVAAVALDNTNEMIEEAVSRGIPVVSIVEAVGTDKYTVKIENDQFHFGKVIAQWLVDELDGEGRVWMLQGLAGLPNSVARDEGALAAFEDANIEVTAQGYGEWSYEKSRQLVENLMITDPNPDGIWTAGATMARAAIDVYQENGLELVPITAEGENGFFRVWTETDVPAVAAVFPPSLFAASVRAMVAVLQGEDVYKDYMHRPDPITIENRDEFYRPDLSDEYWFPSNLPNDVLQDLYGSEE